MIPFDLMKVLTAVTPIVTTIANNSKNNNSTEIVETQRYKEPNINITINNHFYSTPSIDELQAVEEVNKRLISEISVNNNNRYLI